MEEKQIHDWFKNTLNSRGNPKKLILMKLKGVYFWPHEIEWFKELLK